MDFITTFFPPRRVSTSTPGPGRKSDGAASTSPTPAAAGASAIGARDLRQFGVPLAQVLDMYNTCVPPVMREAMDFIDAGDGLRMPYIFRKSVSAQRSQAIQEAANAGRTITFTDPIEAAAIIKLYLREMLEPMIPSRMYDQLLAFERIYAQEERLLRAIDVIEAVPASHKAFLWKLVSLLAKVAQYERENFMGSAQLAAMVGPSLCWAKNSVYMKPADMKALSYFAKFLIDHAGQFFKYDPEYVPDGAWHSKVVNIDVLAEAAAGGGGGAPKPQPRIPSRPTPPPRNLEERMINEYNYIS